MHLPKASQVRSGFTVCWAVVACDGFAGMDVAPGHASCDNYSRVAGWAGGVDLIMPCQRQEAAVRLKQKQ